MNTPNTPAPGTPEWLRHMADCTARCDRDEDAQGLRAAAERIEELDKERDEWYWATASMLFKVPDGVLAGDLRRLRDEVRDELVCLRAENEALKKTFREADVVGRYERKDGRRDWWDGGFYLHTGEIVVQMDAVAFDAARKEALRKDKELLDAARKEGAT